MVGKLREPAEGVFPFSSQALGSNFQNTILHDLSKFYWGIVNHLISKYPHEIITICF